MEAVEYRVTKGECQKQINSRMPIVCCSCGGDVVPIETIGNSNHPTFWIGCMKCMVYDNGVKPEIYKAAEYLVDERHERAYRYDIEPDKSKEPEKHDYWRKTQIRGMCSIVIESLSAYNRYATNEHLLH